MDEKWKIVPGFPNYEASDLGRIRHAFSRRVRKPNRHRKWNYYSVCVHSGGKRKNIKVHRMIAAAFLPNPQQKPQVNHLDGSRLNNKLTNLEWATSAENMLHAWRNGLVPSQAGERNSQAMLGASDVQEIRGKSAEGERAENLARQYGVSKGHIYKIISGAKWGAVH